VINGVLQPTVTATAAMVPTENQAMKNILDPAQQPTQQAPANTNADPDKWYQYSHPDNSAATGANTNPIADQFSGFGFKNWARRIIYEVLTILFEAAALCIDTIRTFKLIVLAILGPLCFGLSVFDGFQHTLKQWLARYINVYMWLPVANIFGAIIAKIQINMSQLQNSGNLQGNEFGNTNTAYLIFLVIGIIGYFTVPSIANYIINVGGHALFSKTSALASMAVTYAGSTVLQSLAKYEGGQGQQNSAEQGGSDSGGNSNYMKDKLSGKT
jgi:conjugative transposon TraJ protein